MCQSGRDCLDVLSICALHMLSMAYPPRPAQPSAIFSWSKLARSLWL